MACPIGKRLYPFPSVPNVKVSPPSAVVIAVIFTLVLDTKFGLLNTFLGWVGIALGALVLAVSPLVKRWMHLDTLEDGVKA